MEWWHIALGIVALLLAARMLGGVRQGAATTTSSVPDDGSVEAALRSGRKIEAIKRYRALHGVGLKEAKEAVDAMEPPQ